MGSKDVIGSYLTLAKGGATSSLKEIFCHAREPRLGNVLVVSGPPESIENSSLSMNVDQFTVDKEMMTPARKAKPSL